MSIYVKENYKADKMNKLQPDSTMCINLANVMLSEEAMPEQCKKHDANYVEFCNWQNLALFYRDTCTAGRTINRCGKVGWVRAHRIFAMLAVFFFLTMMVDRQAFAL